jgi:anti-sigma B factor antagonist
MQSFRISEEELSGVGRLVRVEGELDLAVAGRLQEAIDRAVEASAAVVLSLDACDFIDSTGIAVILRGRSSLEEAGGRLAVFGAKGGVARVFELTGLTDGGLFFATADEARAALGAA